MARVDFYSQFNAGKFTKPNGDVLSIADALQTLWMKPTAFHDQMGMWIRISGFRKWFSRAPITELKRMQGLLVEKAMERLYEVMVMDDPKVAPTQVTAARLIFEMSRVMPEKNKDVNVTIDSKVAAMSDDEKRALIAEAAKLQAIDAEEV